MEENNLPETGEKYRHFKGGVVEIDCVARDTDEPKRRLVAYHYTEDNEGNHLGDYWARSLDEFLEFKELNGEKIKRFKKLE